MTPQRDDMRECRMNGHRWIAQGEGTDECSRCGSTRTGEHHTYPPETRTAEEKEVSLAEAKAKRDAILAKFKKETGNEANGRS